MNLRGIAITASLVLAVFHIYTGISGVFESFVQRSAHLLLVSAVILAAALHDTTASWRRRGITALASAALVLVLAHNIWNGDVYANRMAYVTPLDTASLVLAVVGIAALLTIAWRMLGTAFGLIVSIFLAYALFGQHLPAALAHRGFGVGWILDHLFYTKEGVFGIPLGVSATYIYLFVFFGAILDRCGGGKFFIDLAMAVTGRFRGGPAKAAVVGSAMMGTISGSAVANVVTSGTITIPLMKRSGYEPRFAGAVEAAASSGGQLMPPVMGATAFVIAEFVGRPYGEIALSALIPALLFYLGIFMTVHLEAVRIGLSAEPPAVRLLGALRQGGLYLLPIAVIAYAVFLYSPMRAGLYGAASVILVAAAYALLRAEPLLLPRRLVEGAVAAGQAIAPVAVACAASGLIVGVLSLTGLGITINDAIVTMAGASVAAALVLTMISSLILGMGLPTVAAYLVQVGVTIPALVKLGVDPVAAHFFVFYFAILGNVTPPVAVAAYAASAISGSDPAATGWKALMISLPAFIVPFIFAIEPALLLRGAPLPVLTSTVTAAIGVAALAAAVVGQAFERLNAASRAVLFTGAVLTLYPGLYSDLLGLGLTAGAVGLDWFTSQTRKRPAASEGGIR
jgi:TRAP transporter 4TM/12TM fusion protein